MGYAGKMAQEGDVMVGGDEGAIGGENNFSHVRVEMSAGFTNVFPPDGM